jgi:hypothetical protein
MGSVYRVRRLQTGWQIFADDEEVKAEVRKCLRQESKDFYAAGVDALVKRWDKCISVDGGYVEKQMFVPGSNITYFYALYPFVAYLLTLPHTKDTFLYYLVKGTDFHISNNFTNDELGRILS